MGERVVETLIGAVVLIVAGAFFAYAYTRSSVRTADGYELRAKFGSVGGLAVGSDVRISGIKVGTVTREELDPQTYLAIVHMNIEPHVKVPDDSAIRIAQESLLGGNYLAIEPGGSEDTLKPGQEVAHTQGAVDLLSLVGQAIFSARGSGGGQAGGEAQGQGGPSASGQGGSSQSGALGLEAPPFGPTSSAAPAPSGGTPPPAAQDQPATQSSPSLPSSDRQSEHAAPQAGGETASQAAPSQPAPPPNFGP